MVERVASALVTLSMGFSLDSHTDKTIERYLSLPIPVWACPREWLLCDQLFDAIVIPGSRSRNAGQ